MLMTSQQGKGLSHVAESACWTPRRISCLVTPPHTHTPEACLRKTVAMTQDSLVETLPIQNQEELCGSVPEVGHKEVTVKPGAL